MKKYIMPTIWIVLFLVTFSCKSKHTPYTVKLGEYNFYFSKEKKQKNMLILKADSSFILTLSGRYQNPSCIGNWEFIDKNIIKLECMKGSVPMEYLSFDYINERTRLIKIIDSNTIKMPIFDNVKRKYVILKREK